MGGRDSSHTRTVVRECFEGDEASQWKSPKIRPLATPKPFNRSSQKHTCVITSWTALDMQNFVSIGSGVSVPDIRDFAVLLGWLVFSLFFGFFKATAYTPKRIFTQSTSEHVVPGMEVPFGGLDNYIWYIDPEIFENRHFGDRFWLDSFFFRGRKPL